MAQSNNAIHRRGNSSTSLSGSHSSPSHGSDSNPLTYHWHDKQEIILRELEEARARATQMEKTMRWWSDCTANWREKWSKVRSERNKAREEVRLLRSRLESIQREILLLKREKNHLENEISLSDNGHHVPSKLHSVNIPEALPSHHKNQDSNHQTLLYQSDSPERDGSNFIINSLSDHPSIMSDDDLKMLHQAKETNLNLLEEMFGSMDEITKGVENVSVFVHSASDASKLCSLSKTEDSHRLSETYLMNEASRIAVEMQNGCIRENDVEDKIQIMMNSGAQVQLPHNTIGNSSSQHSPSHRISAISDCLPDDSNINTQNLVTSDPLSEGGGTSDCSETGYAESIRSSEGVISRRWRQGEVSNFVLDDSGITPEQDSLEQQATMFKLRLDEATKTIQAERDEKNLLDRENLRWQSEVCELRSRLEDVRVSRQEVVKELVSLRALHQKEVQTLQLEMLDDASTRECIDRRLADLRSELERLQEENAAEWGRRERLESEKLSLERENKKLRSQIIDLEERLDKRNKMASSIPDSDISNLKEEISDKNKKLADLRHAHSKLKKVLADKSIELQHCNRRADQYEGEVKRLRARVDELKKELANSEDEVDCASNNIRKLQRSNDEYQETVENLQVEVKHLQSRLRSSQTSLPLRANSLLQDSDEDD